MGSSRLMAPFFILLLIGSMVPFNIAPLAAAKTKQVELTTIAGTIEVPNDPWSVPVKSLTLTAEQVRLDSGLTYTVQHFKDYDVLLGLKGETLVHNMRIYVEVLNGKQWKQLGIPISLIYEKVSDTYYRVIRGFTDYLGTTYDVVYHVRAGEAVKYDVVLHSSAAAEYRVVWSLSGITLPLIEEYSREYRFIGSEDMWLGFNWNDTTLTPTLVLSSTAQGRKLDITFNIGQVEAGEIYVLDPTIIEEYSFTNRNYWVSINRLHPSADSGTSAQGQSFETPAVDHILYAIDVMLVQYSGTHFPDGNATIQVFAHNAGIPNGAALATSDPYELDELWGGGSRVVRFFFSGADQITLNATTWYVFAVGFTAVGTVDASNQYLVGMGTSGAPGGRCRYTNGGWITQTNDLTFAVLSAGAPTIIDVTPTTAFSVGEYGWVNVTVQEDMGIASLNTVTLYANTTGAAQNFTLRWTQATDAFTEEDDPDNIITLAGSVREDLNATATMLGFRFSIASTAAEGDLDVRIIVVNDDALEDDQLYPALFAFVGIEWNLIADIINAAFALFGVLEYMTQITTYITGLVGWFTISLVNIILIVTEQFVFITLVFSSLIYWFSEFLGVIVEFVTFVQDILNGVSVWYNDLGVLWDWIGWNTWSPVLPYALFILWLCSIGERSRYTPGGEIQVLINDFNTTANVSSWFLGVFSFVANTVIDRVYGLISARS